MTLTLTILPPPQPVGSPELSRRVATLMHTDTIMDLSSKDEMALILAVERSVKFEDLPASVQKVISQAEEELSASTPSSNGRRQFHLPGRHPQKSHGSKEAVRESTALFGHISDLEITYPPHSEGLVKTRVRELFGNRVEPRDVANAIGILPHSEIRMSIGDLGLSISVKGETKALGKFEQERVVARESMGPGRFAPGLTLLMNGMTVERTGTGVGTKMLAHIIDEAPKLGIQKLKTYASKETGLNGYYTWPRLGYNAPLPQSIKEKLPDHLKSATDLHSLMTLRSGPSWWKDNGRSIVASFDLEPNSKSRRIFDAYRKLRGI